MENQSTKIYDKFIKARMDVTGKRLRDEVLVKLIMVTQDPITRLEPLFFVEQFKTTHRQTMRMASSQYLYEVRPRKDKRGADLISDALPFGRLWYAGPKCDRQGNWIRAAPQPVT
jgi:hypothetical protein